MNQDDAFERWWFKASVRFDRSSKRFCRQSWDAALANASPQEAQDLSRYTTPHPIGDLHEDHGEVIAARWRDGALEDWACTSLLSAGFDAEDWTHFYRFPPVQPPTP